MVCEVGGIFHCMLLLFLASKLGVKRCCAARGVDLPIGHKTKGLIVTLKTSQHFLQSIVLTSVSWPNAVSGNNMLPI